MDSADKLAFYICVISRNKMARLGKVYSMLRKKYVSKILKFKKGGRVV